MGLLEQTERSVVEERLFEEIKLRPDSPRAWFVDRVTDPQYPLDLGERSVPRDQIKHALNLAETQNGQKYPNALLEILDELAATGEELIRVIRDKVKARLAAAAVAVPGNPVNCLLDNLLEGNFPFFNRSVLRSKLTTLLGPLSRPLFVVNGEDGSGRSYTRNLLEHCYIRTNTFRHVPIVPQLDPDLAGEALPEDLALDIINMMGLQPDRQALPARDSSVTVNQYGLRLTRWLLEHIKVDDEHVYWIVLDGFGCDKLNDWTRSFISCLAQKITVGVYRQRVKLILLNYPTDKLEAVEGYYDEEVVKIVTVGDVKAYLKWWFESKGEPFTDEDITETMQALLQAPPSGDNEPLTTAQLKSVSKALREMANG